MRERKRQERTQGHGMNIWSMHNRRKKDKMVVEGNPSACQQMCSCTVQDSPNAKRAREGNTMFFPFLLLRPQCDHEFYIITSSHVCMTSVTNAWTQKITPAFYPQTAFLTRPANTALQVDLDMFKKKDKLGKKLLQGAKENQFSHLVVLQFGYKNEHVVKALVWLYFYKKESS